MIVIASHAHLHGLGQRLVDQDINVAAALASDQYIPLDAEELRFRSSSSTAGRTKTGSGTS